VRAVGRRTKKLIVAFHFHLFSNQAGWKCDECRKAGLDVKRRCGWLPTVNDVGQRVVWARKQAATNTCPKSYISAQSVAWLEEFVVRRKLGQRWPENLGARAAEAFLILESEWEAEAQNG
jgi:hypothetical protein